jgi:hypothetical protein
MNPALVGPHLATIVSFRDVLRERNPLMRPVISLLILSSPAFAARSWPSVALMTSRVHCSIQSQSSSVASTKVQCLGSTEPVIVFAPPSMVEK